jgi:putative PIN family toxin of toxin-antitoxin system
MTVPSASSPGRRELPRLVLDTNVWLDLLVFRDPGVAALAHVIARRQVEVLTDDACSAELRRVLGYGFGRFTLDEHARASCWRRFLARATFWTEARPETGALPLPRCSDPDDQPFLELAAACGADALVTRDRALLRLGGPRRRLNFAIVTPAWTATLPACAASA